MVAVKGVSVYRGYFPSKICALLEFYTVYNGSFLPTFWDNLSVPSSRVKQSKKKCFLLDFPEDLYLMFLSLIAVLIFCSLPQLLVDTEVGLFHC
jgi:hypothetical protein